MPKLNAQDASFLALETPESPMHIGVLLTFKLPAGAGIDSMQKLHEKLERFPVDAEPFNLRLVQKDGLRRLQPQWERVDEVDLEYHLRHEALPWPGGERELGLAISRLHSLPLERSRPLWECTLIEGLQPRRFALYLKLHHAVVDGIGLMHQMTQILAESPRGMSLPPWSAPVATPRAHKATHAADDDWRHLLQELLAGLGKPRAASRPPAIPRGPQCLLNGNTTARRRFATQTLPLPRVKAIAAAADATVNDVVLAVCGGALRDYLRQFDQVPGEPLLASIPVALPRNGSAAGANSVASVYATLATHLADPRERLLAIRDATREAKEEFRRIPAALSRAINSIGMYAMSLMQKQPNRDPDHASFTNLTISNVPGPRQPLYFYGAELEGMFPVSVLAGDHRLNITVLGYHDRLHFGLVACPDTLPSMQRLAVLLPQALDALEAALRRRRAAPGGPGAKTTKSASGVAARRRAASTEAAVPAKTVKPAKAAPARRAAAG